VVFGASASRAMYGLSVLGAFALLLPMAWQSSPLFLVPLILMPAALRLQRDFAASAPGLPYNSILVRTFKLELGYAALLAFGAIAARWLA
jgi:1,4-dihydroxy-2-naphthoate octaprenyltransferase